MRRFIALLLVLLLAVSAAAADPLGITVREEDGGEFRPLPISLEGGSPLPYEFDYNQKFSFYEDPTIRVERYRVDGSEWGATYWYATVTLKDASQLRTASASVNNPFLDGTIIPCHGIAKRNRAVLAINGDYCASFSSEKPTDFILRQGVVYRDSVMPGLDLLLIDEDGDFHILNPDETDLETADKTTVNGKKVINAFQFGPALVINGEPVPDEKVLDYGRCPHFTNPDRRAQRMIICQTGPLQYMVLCCANYGLPLTTMRDLALSLGPVQTAYNLDGGESSQISFLGRWFNNGANGNTKARGITDIIYFASAWFKD